MTTPSGKFSRTDRRVRGILLGALVLLAVLGGVRIGMHGASDTQTMLVAGRTPLVYANGKTEPLATTDYLTSPGGASLNGATPAAGELRATTVTAGQYNGITTGFTGGLIPSADGAGGFQAAATTSLTDFGDGDVEILGSTTAEFDFVTKDAPTNLWLMFANHPASPSASAFEIDYFDGAAYHIAVTIARTLAMTFGGDVSVNGRLSTTTTGLVGTDLTVGNASGRRRTLNMSAPTSVSHGSVSADASFSIGRIFSIGANTSTVLTISGGATAKNCTMNAVPGTYTTPGYFIQADMGTPNQITFSCLKGSDSSAGNCPDFDYICVY